jgi:hypothetical protein
MEIESIHIVGRGWRHRRWLDQAVESLVRNLEGFL